MRTEFIFWLAAWAIVAALLHLPAHANCPPMSPASKVIKPNQDLRTALLALKPGQELRLAAGTHKVRRNVRMPPGAKGKKILIAPQAKDGKCVNAVISYDKGSIYPGSHTEIAKLKFAHKIDCTSRNGDERCNQYRPIHTERTSNVLIRDNTFGPGGDLLYVGNHSRDITITGNRFQKSKRWCIGVRGAITRRVTIENNVFDSCDGDFIQTEDQHDLRIHANLFKGRGSWQILDLKTPQGATKITGNTFDCAGVKGACVLFHAETKARQDKARHVFSDNRIHGCPRNGRFGVFGGNKDGYWYDLAIRSNSFTLQKGGDKNCRIQIWRCRNCSFEHNTVESGTLRFHVEMSGLKVLDNVFDETGFSQERRAATCLNNVMYQPRGANMNYCKGTETRRPAYIKPPTNMALSSDSLSGLGTGSNGLNRGVFAKDSGPPAKPPADSWAEIRNMLKRMPKEAVKVRLPVEIEGWEVYGVRP